MSTVRKNRWGIIATVLSGGFMVLAATLCRAGETAPDESFQLKNPWQIGEAVRVVAEFEVGGDLKIRSQGKIQKVPMSVVATMKYEERLLLESRGETRLLRSIRHYDQGEAVIKVGKAGVQPQLSQDRRLIVVQAGDGAGSMFSPVGPLTREELDLISMVGNSLVVDELLPSEKVSAGETWKHDEQTMVAFLGLDAVSVCDVQSVFSAAEKGSAKVEIGGTVEGAIEGVATKIELKGKYLVDLEKGRIVAMNLALKEDRSIGHVGPGVDVVSKLKLKIEPIGRPDQLGNDVLDSLVTDPDPGHLLLRYDSGAAGIRFLCDPRWFVTDEEPSVVVLRLIDRGDLIAQCNVSPLSRRSPEKTLTLAQYQHEVKHALGKNFDRIISAGEWTDDFGQRVYRVVAHGQAEKLPIEWRYYLLTNKKGDRAAAVFTVEAPLAERLDELDRQLIASLEVVPSDKNTLPASDAKTTAAKPETNRTK